MLNKLPIEIPLTNVGRAKLTVSNVALAKDDGIFRIESKPEIVESGRTENIVVVFQPLAEQSYEDMEAELGRASGEDFLGQLVHRPTLALRAMERTPMAAATLTPPMIHGSVLAGFGG